MSRSLIWISLVSVALAGCGLTGLLIPGCKAGPDETRYYIDLDTSKTKGCWNLASGYPTDALCIFDSVLVRYSARNDSAMLQCSLYFPYANTIMVHDSKNRFWNLKTGAQRSDDSYDPDIFHDHTAVLEDTLITFSHITDNPNSCVSMYPVLKGQRDLNSKFKSQIQMCDSMGYKTF
jgi:hypothetical protein